ncbi:serine/threonine kinases, PknB [Haloferula helveola]|uniref:Serine/threonine kinases, PknB n=1 Tax=Haloferula helveola TaxID=490095 RepID=A0ABM7RAQ8_9BACT|nr:serine/threonine kinases, PknB [Haloferula helveola]
MALRKKLPIPRLRTKSRLGKYRIEGVLAEGHYATLYRALDTIEARRVALKIPHPHLADEEFIESFLKEARLAASVDHPCLLSLKDASYINDLLVMAYPLGQESLADRLTRRIASASLSTFIENCLEGLAALHARRIIHCDIKPENFIVFPGPTLRLADFGIARQARRTLNASGSGTLGYMAPEQAMGRASTRSDVFAIGLLLHRMITGHVPEYPFKWPAKGYDRLRRKARPEFIALLKRALDVEPRKRFRDAGAFLAAYRQTRKTALILR